MSDEQKLTHIDEKGDVRMVDVSAKPDTERIAVAEGFMLAKMAGVDPNTVYQAIRGGLAGSTVMDAKGPMMLSGNTDPGFRIDLHIKDLNNAIETAHACGAPLPVTAEVMEMMEYLHFHGCGKMDHSALAKYYENLTGASLSEK